MPTSILFSRPLQFIMSTSNVLSDILGVSGSDEQERNVKAVEDSSKSVLANNRESISGKTDTQGVSANKAKPFDTVVVVKGNRSHLRLLPRLSLNPIRDLLY